MRSPQTQASLMRGPGSIRLMSLMGADPSPDGAGPPPRRAETSQQPSPQAGRTPGLRLKPGRSACAKSDLAPSDGGLGSAARSRNDVLLRKLVGEATQRYRVGRPDESPKPCAHAAPNHEAGVVHQGHAGATDEEPEMRPVEDTRIGIVETASQERQRDRV